MTKSEISIPERAWVNEDPFLEESMALEAEVEVPSTTPKVGCPDCRGG